MEKNQMTAAQETTIRKHFDHCGFPPKTLRWEEESLFVFDQVFHMDYEILANGYFRDENGDVYDLEGKLANPSADYTLADV